MDSLRRKKNPSPQTVRHKTAPVTPLVLIHGFRGTRQGLGLIAKHLTELSKQRGTPYALLAPDLPGFGNGATLSKYTLDTYVAWLRSYIRTVQKRFPDQKITLLGHSFGSIICAAYSARYPDSIKDLILVNPIGAPALEGPKKTLTQLAVLYYTVGAKLPNRLAHMWLASPLIVRIMSISMAKTKNKELLRFIHEQHDTFFSRFHTPQSVLESFHVSVNYTVADFAKNIPVRTLLIAGAVDDITPLSAQFKLVKLFPRATLKVIDNVGHLTHYETPGAVAQQIQAFSNPL